MSQSLLAQMNRTELITFLFLPVFSQYFTFFFRQTLKNGRQAQTEGELHWPGADEEQGAGEVQKEEDAEHG